VANVINTNTAITAQRSTEVTQARQATKMARTMRDASRYSATNEDQVRQALFVASQKQGNIANTYQQNINLLKAAPVVINDRNLYGAVTALDRLFPGTVANVLDVMAEQEKQNAQRLNSAANAARSSAVV
jgi:hypothetical protein